MITQGKSRKTKTGSIYHRNRKKKKYEMGREKIYVRIGEERKKIIDSRGGNRKIRILSTQTANVIDSKTGKSSKVKIKSVVENPADMHFVRRNIITKGAIIETEKGKAKVTSRPSQDGIVNAVLIE
ncbi:MAG: 30S ribosomal protein S8e [Candidatus Aenigmarchaeota archaeon]|nr:30S ribosomal protein S8e [Candidatus Aenigmarchaeota archaeon]